jgi:hypothetical protein
MEAWKTGRKSGMDKTAEEVGMIIWNKGEYGDLKERKEERDG